MVRSRTLRDHQRPFVQWLRLRLCEGLRLPPELTKRGCCARISVQKPMDYVCVGGRWRSGEVDGSRVHVPLHLTTPRATVHSAPPGLHSRAHVKDRALAGCYASTGGSEGDALKDSVT